MAVSPLAVPCEAKPGQPCTERPTSLWLWGKRGRPVAPHGRRIRLASKPTPTTKPAPEIRP